VLSGEKILITGAGGTIAEPVAEFLAADNEVWGAARFSDPARRAAADAKGIRTVPVDLAGDDLSALPTDFTYVLHFAWIRCPPGDFERAGRINADAAGRVIAHCRNAKGVLLTSSVGVYSPHPDPYFAYGEDHYLGVGCSDAFLEANAAVRMFNPTSAPAKLATEAVARFASTMFEVPLVVARLTTAYGTTRLFPARYIRELIAGETSLFPGDPYPHTPLHIDDLCRQTGPLLGAAEVGGTIVNWSGDEVVAYQDYARLPAAWMGVEPNCAVVPLPGYPPGLVSDKRRRLSITGPCQVRFEDAVRQLYEQVRQEGS